MFWRIKTTTYRISRFTIDAVGSRSCGDKIIDSLERIVKKHSWWSKSFSHLGFEPAFAHEYFRWEQRRIDTCCVVLHWIWILSIHLRDWIFHLSLASQAERNGSESKGTQPNIGILTSAKLDAAYLSAAFTATQEISVIRLCNSPTKRHKAYQNG